MIGPVPHPTSPARAAAPTPILFVHHAGIDWVRGSTRCLLDLLTHIDRARFAPVVWCNQPTIRAAVEAIDVPVYAARFWEGCHPLRPDRTWVNDTLAIIRRHGIRLVHTDEFTQVGMLLRATRRTRIPLVAHLHQVPTPDERLYALLHQADLSVGTSRACIAGLLQDGVPEARTAVIYNAVDPERLSRGDATRLRTTLGIPADAVVVSQVGSLIHRKAVDITLHALAACRAREQIHLLLCGDGPERGALEALAGRLGLGPRTHFLGECAAAGAILRDVSDIMVAPSREESFGLTLTEAGLFGVATIASRIAPHVEVLGDDAGLLVAPEDVGGFAAALDRLASEEKLRKQLGQAAQARVESMFLVRRYVHDFEETYRRLLEARPETYSWARATLWPREYYRWLRAAALRRLHRTRRVASRPMASDAN